MRRRMTRTGQVTMTLPLLQGPGGLILEVCVQSMVLFMVITYNDPIVIVSL